MIAFIMFLLLWSGERFGVSSTLPALCSMAGAGKKIPFFSGGWKKQSWNLVFVLGAVIGGYVAVTYLGSNEPLQLSSSTVNDLSKLGVEFDGEIAPLAIFNWESLLTIKGFLIMVVGGFLVGFGTRWAGGCTSGHAISGLASLQLPSLLAVVGFFIGGLLMTHFIFPLIF
jgi:uncharacterized membrane protein YedE/YeeE